MTKIRLFSIVLLATTGVACKIDSLPPRPNDGASADMTAGMDSIGPDLGSTAPVDRDRRNHHVDQVDFLS